MIALLPPGPVARVTGHAARTKVTASGAGDGLHIAAEGVVIQVAAGSAAISIRAFDTRPLVQSDLSFSFDDAALRPLLRGRAERLPAAAHVLRLLDWHAIGDGAVLRAATDDPLGRSAIVAITAPAVGVIRIGARLSDDRAVTAVGLRWRSGPDEHFFGLGEQFGGVDQRGRRVGILVQDGMTTLRPRGGYAPSPFFISSRGYGFYLAGSRPSIFSLDAPPAPTDWLVTARATTLDAYVLAGPRPADVLAHYGRLTGYPPLPPPWTLGVWHTSIGGQARVEADALHLRRAHIPASVIWTYDAIDESVKLGWPYPIFARIPPGPYPNLPAFTAELHREGFKVLGYVAPEFTRSRPGFAYPARHGYFVRGSGHIYLLDLTNPAALAWWEGDLRQILGPLGFDGWLYDLGDRLPRDARFFNGRGAEDMANLYPILLAGAADAAVRATKPGAIFVMRSGFAGIQRYQRAVWAGDQRANWDPRQGLPAAVSAGLSWGISGAPFWGSDIGGYLDGGLPPARQEELWLRWLEFGALSPIMRDQLGNKGYDAIYLWSNAHTEAAFRFYADLHQALFPYLYAAARVAHRMGMPIMRPLFLAYPDDHNVYGLNDEYLLGPNLLVAPVIAPDTAGRSVYLPAGQWVDYWTGAQVIGGRTLQVAAPLDRIPIFVRGGALLPLLADPGDTLAPAGDPSVHEAGAALLLRLFPGGAGETTILADGTTLDHSLSSRQVALHIAGPARRYTVLAPLARAPMLVRLDGRVAPGSSGGTLRWHFDPHSHLLRIDVRLDAGRHLLTVQVP
jgi:alpha-D-xyloside xylohydrolase